MARKNANGYGGITKLSGNRKKPYMAYISEFVEEGTMMPSPDKKPLKTKIKALEGITDVDVMRQEVIELLQGKSVDELRHIAANMLKEDEKKYFKVKQVKKAIGYFETSKAAQIALAEYNKSPFDLNNKKITFSEVWQQVLPTLNLDKLSEPSRHRYLWGFEACKPIHNMPLADIRAAHMQEIVDSYADKSKSTQTKPIAAMRAVYDFAIKNDIVDKDYAKFVKYNETAPKNAKTALTKEEVQFLWNNINYRHESRGLTNLTNAPVVEIMLVLVYTGLRIQELLTLKVDCVHLDKNYLEIKGTKTAAANRVVPIHNKIKPIIAARCSGEYLFESEKGGHINYDSFLTNAYKTFCDKFNYKHTIHEHRHTFATYSALTMDSKARAFIIGHSQGITDDIYTHPEMIVDMLHDEINKLDI